MRDMRDERNESRPVSGDQAGPGRATPDEVVPDVVIAELPRGDGAKVVVKVATYKGRKRLDIREEFLTEEGRWQPTKKGVSVSPDQAEALRKAVAAGVTALAVAPVSVQMPASGGGR